MASAVFNSSTIAEIAIAKLEELEADFATDKEEDIKRAMEPRLVGPWYRRRLLKRTREQAQDVLMEYDRYHYTSHHSRALHRHRAKTRPWLNLKEAALGSLNHGSGKVTLDHDEISLIRSAAKVSSK